MHLVQLGLALVLAVTVVVKQAVLADENSVLATATLKSAKAATRELKTAIEVVGDCKRV
jgi:hypothetical protein